MRTGQLKAALQGRMILLSRRRRPLCRALTGFLLPGRSVHFLHSRFFLAALRLLRRFLLAFRSGTALLGLGRFFRNLRPGTALLLLLLAALPLLGPFRLGYRPILRAGCSSFAVFLLGSLFRSAAAGTFPVLLFFIHIVPPG
jgi:hypothetical protein